ncbi:MAG: hypothetical protein EPO40_03035 [Myxococcaceae bacterium]|nr:MAG: hypothetical protein EPO40_03035 [Myxococcaceae bacterium]
MPSRQQQPWAAGKHKPKPGQKRRPTASGRGLGKIAGRAKRGARKALRKHPMLGVLLQVLLGIVAVVALVLGVVLESSLYYLVMAMGGLGTLAIRRAQQMERTRQGAQPKARPTTGGPKTPPPTSSGAKPAADAPLKCTATGRPLDGDDRCDCHSRHVRQQKNANRMRLPLGHPYGKPK